MFLHTENTINKSTGRTKKMKKLLAVFIGALITCFALTACGDTSSANSNNKVPIVYDVTKFANISSAELVNLLGEPHNISETTPATGFVEIPCTYYDYYDNNELGDVSFVLINDEVVKFIAYNDFPFYKKDKLLGSLNIQSSEECVMAAESETALRYRCVTDVIDDIHVTLIEDDTYGFLAVTYDMIYFEEWYLPTTITEESDYQYFTQECVKSILKAPKSADFASTWDWIFVKNDFYVGVQAYVDALNSFGAKIRSDFTFIYSAGSSNIVYAVFDGEVIADNGYRSTEELVKQLVKDNKPTTKNNNTNTSKEKTQTSTSHFSTEDLNEFFVAYILPKYVTLQGELHNPVQYDSNDSTDWCSKITGQVGTDSYEAMVYPFQLGKGNEITDLWIAYIYWNGNLLEYNDYSERINYSPKKYW